MKIILKIINLLQWQYIFLYLFKYIFLNLFKYIIVFGNCHFKSLLFNYIINDKKFIKIIYYYSIHHFNLFIKNYLHNNSFIIILDDYIITNYLIYNFQIL